MDYKYIEQLLERYWECETTLQEEQILRSFFQQEDVPAHLQVYVSVFRAETEIADSRLGSDFDERILNMVEPAGDVETVHPHRISMARRFRPFYQAAGLVALLLTIGTAAQHSFSTDDSIQSQTEQYAEGDTGLMPEEGITPLPQQQSASIPVNMADTLEFTR